MTSTQIPPTETGNPTPPILNMTHSAIIKSFKLRLDKPLKGSPNAVTLCCVYSYNGLIGAPMGIGYVLAVDDTITEIRCENEGVTPTQAFMNSDKINIKVDSHNTLEVSRIWFMDVNGDGVYKAGMILGPNGDEVIVTSNVEVEDFKTVGLSL